MILKKKSGTDWVLPKIIGSGIGYPSGTAYDYDCESQCDVDTVHSKEMYDCMDDNYGDDDDPWGVGHGDGNCYDDCDCYKNDNDDIPGDVVGQVDDLLLHGVETEHLHRIVQILPIIVIMLTMLIRGCS